MKSLLALLAVCFLVVPGPAPAESIKIQNANFAAGASKVVVTGKLIGFGKTNNIAIEDSLSGELLAELSAVRKNFNAQIDRGEDQAVPCSVTVTSGEESAISEVRHAPADCSNRLTLSGLVTDSALPFASVVVRVGSQTFTTVADENGFYSLDIATVSVGDLVTIETAAANPNDPGETINFVNLAGTFSKLLSDPVENVTNVTTAQFALLVEANGGQAPTSEQELRDAETHVDATRLLELAAVIKLIVDDSAHSLPLGFDSIISFIADASAVDQYIADVNANEPNAIADAISVILTDNNLVEGFTTSDIPSFYYAIERAIPGFLSRSGDGIEFDSVDFTGTLLNIQGGGSGFPVPADFDWGVVDGVLELSFPNPAVASGKVGISVAAPGDQVVIDEYWRCAVDTGARIMRNTRLLESSLTRVVDGSLVDIVSRSDRLEYSFDDVPTITDLPDCSGDSIRFATRFESFTFETTLRSSADINQTPFSNGPGGVDILGSWAIEYYYNPGADLFNSPARRVVGNLLTFNADGTGSKLFDDEDLTDQTFSWEVISDDLVIRYPDGWTQTSRILDQEGKQYGVFHDFTNGTDRFATYDITIKQDPSYAFTEADLISPVGKFWNGMINLWIPDANFSDGSWRFDWNFGWIFDQQPDGIHPFTLLDDVDPLRWWFDVAMTWEILPDGMLHTSYAAFSWARQRFWIPLSEEPISQDPVTGEPIVPATRRFYVLEYETQPPVRRFQPRINIEQEVDIPDYDLHWYCALDGSCAITP
jgi:hypothetical protein